MMDDKVFKKMASHLNALRKTMNANDLSLGINGETGDIYFFDSLDYHASGKIVGLSVNANSIIGNVIEEVAIIEIETMLDNNRRLKNLGDNDGKIQSSMEYVVNLDPGDRAMSEDIGDNQ